MSGACDIQLFSFLFSSLFSFLTCSSEYETANIQISISLEWHSYADGMISKEQKDDVKKGPNGGDGGVKRTKGIQT